LALFLVPLVPAKLVLYMKYVTNVPAAQRVRGIMLNYCRLLLLRLRSRRHRRRALNFDCRPKANTRARKLRKKKQLAVETNSERVALNISTTPTVPLLYIIHYMQFTSSVIAADRRTRMTCLILAFISLSDNCGAQTDCGWPRSYSRSLN
jgi:hypothetical protein